MFINPIITEFYGEDISYEEGCLSVPGLRGRVSHGQRIQAMLDARELAVGLIRGRLLRQHPGLSTRELNLKVLEEIARAERTPPGP